MRVLGPMLVGGAAACGALVLSLFIEPRDAERSQDGISVSREALALPAGAGSPGVWAPGANHPTEPLPEAGRLPARTDALPRAAPVPSAFVVAPAQLVRAGTSGVVARSARSVAALGDLALAHAAIERFDLDPDHAAALFDVVRARRALVEGDAEAAAVLRARLVAIAGARADELANWLDDARGV